jgi:hypothetical protein
MFCLLTAIGSGLFTSGQAEAIKATTLWQPIRPESLIFPCLCPALASGFRLYTVGVSLCPLRWSGVQLTK